MSQSIKEKLSEIFQTVFSLEGSEITIMTRENSEKWDRMAHTSLMLCIEEEFGLSIDFETSEELNSFEYILAYLKSQP